MVKLLLAVSPPISSCNTKIGRVEGDGGGVTAANKAGKRPRAGDISSRL